MKFIDLFAWIWGIRIWFQNAWFQCVFSNDFDKNAKITYDLNIDKADELTLWDIQLISSDNIPSFDILCGGFPCQPFSIAWYREGFEDQKGRWNLFFDIIRILKDKKPQAFLLENVKNLKTHNKGHTMKVIYEQLTNLWYHVTDKVLNSMEYWNVPQNRERIYIIWFLDVEVFKKFKFPEKIPLTTNISDCLEDTVDEKYYYKNSKVYDKIKGDITEEWVLYQRRRKYVRENKSWVCPTLTANMGTGGHNVPLLIDKKGIRKLTPRECANFQGFPRDFKLPPIADSHLYKQFWNSVSVPVIERIAKNMHLAFM